MNYYTLDAETFYGTKYTLKSLTYEQYIKNDDFLIHGVGLKLNSEPTQYIPIDSVVRILRAQTEPYTLVCHNALFDASILGWLYDIHPVAIHCTQAMSRALWNQRPATLKQLCISCFTTDETIRKGDELEDFKNKRVLTAEESVALGNYCINDVDITWACYKQMRNWFPVPDLMSMDMTIKMFTNPVLLLDDFRVARFRDECVELTEQAIEQSGLSRSLMASNPQFAQWILDQGMQFEQIDSPTPKNPANKKWPLAKDSQEFGLLKADNPQYGKIWKAHALVKSTIDISRSNRLLEHRNEKGQIAIPLNSFKAHTLRWGGTNKINPQNFKRGSELRKSLFAPPGYQIVVVDSSNIESRLVAWLAGCETILEIYKNNQDLYAIFASTLFGRPINKRDDPLERFIGKVLILGLSYGMGMKTLRSTLAQGALGGEPVYITEVEAKSYVNMYRKTYAEIPKLWEECTKMLYTMCSSTKTETFKCLKISQARIKLPTSLHLNYPDIRGDEVGNRYQFSYWNGKFRKDIWGGALTENIIQALARIIIRDNMNDIQYNILDNLSHTSRIALTVHDEVAIVVPNKDAEAVYHKSVEVMSQPPDWCNDGSLVLAAEGGWAVNYSK